MPLLRSDLKPGDIIIADAGFSCLPPGPHQVQEDKTLRRELFVPCHEGRHYLFPHSNETPLTGFSKKDQT